MRKYKSTKNNQKITIGTEYRKTQFYKISADQFPLNKGKLLRCLKLSLERL